MRAERQPNYANCRDSGVEWLGHVPDHWRLIPLKRAAACPVNKADEGEEYPFIALEYIQPERGRPIAGFEWEDRPAAGCAKFLPGDVLFGKLRPYLCKCLLADRAGCCPTELLVLKPAPGLTASRYLYYLTQGRSFVGLAIATSYGTKMPRTSWEKLGPERVCLPPLDEQRAIAEFLDRETGRIDALIEKKRRLIELLEEKRTALITRAVTKGLDPDAPLKPSGIEWLGDIPEHWGLTKLQHLTPDDRPIRYGIVLPGPDVPEGVPLVKGGDVDAGRLRPDDLSKVAHDVEVSHPKSRLNPGDLLYAIRGSVGDVEMVPEELAGANITQDVARVSPVPNISVHWLLHALRSTAVFCQLQAGTLGAAITGVNIRDLRRAMVPVPPPDEQAAIADHLNLLSRRTDQLRALCESAITTLHEYRTALISAAVTGKIDVREGDNCR